jgi:hypothetical protein
LCFGKFDYHYVSLLHVLGFLFTFSLINLNISLLMVSMAGLLIYCFIMFDDCTFTYD